MHADLHRCTYAFRNRENSVNKSKAGGRERDVERELRRQRYIRETDIERDTEKDSRE